MKMMQALSPRFLEQLTDARSADPSVHLDEIRTAGGNERHGRFASHRSRQQRLAGSRRADEQDAARHTSANGRETLRILEKVDDFLDFILRFVNTCHVGKRHRDELGIDGAGPLERRHAACDGAEQRETRKAEQQQTERDCAITARRARILNGLHIEVDATLRKICHEARVRRDVALRRDRHTARTIGELELEHLLRLPNVSNASRLDVVEEI